MRSTGWACAAALAWASAACGTDEFESGPGSGSGAATAAGGSTADGGATTGGGTTSMGGAGGSTGPGANGGAGGAGGSGPDPLPLGTVTNVAAHPCDSTAPQGATCQQGTVSCPGLPDIGFQLAVVSPTGTPAGTVLMIYGGGGTQYFSVAPVPFAASYAADGFRVVELRFPTAWEASPAGNIKLAACRVATIAQWTFVNIHGSSITTAFCGHGHSGGSGAMGYAMAHYGLETILDYVVYDAGPVFGRMDFGCDPPALGDPDGMRYVCPQLQNGPFAYGGASSLINGWENTSTCGTPYGDAAAALAKWQADSVVSSGADYAYPDTKVAFWYCANNSNEATGQGSFFIDEVTSEKAVTCVQGSCMVEPPWSDPQGFLDMVAAMATDCIPRHQ